MNQTSQPQHRRAFQFQSPEDPKLSFQCFAKHSATDVAKAELAPKYRLDFLQV